jgi:DNA-binding NarL/FixJ family response regulator
MVSEIGDGDSQNRLGHNSPIGPHQGRTYLGAAGLRTSEGHRRSSRPMRAGKPVICMGMIDEKSFTRECIIRRLQALDDRLDIVPFATCEDVLKNAEGHDLILYYIHEDASKWDGQNQKFFSCKKLLNLMPVIILSDIDNPDTLIDLFESGARGFVPTATATVEQVIEIIDLVTVGGIFVPLSILCLLKTRSGGIAARQVSNNQFTASELAILDRLKLGKANKIIAHELGVSESTVKVHIGRIMKKLKVTNRTQVVSRAYALTARATASIGEEPTSASGPAGR